MKSSQALLIFFLVALAILIGNSVFNYAMDAQCYYRCPEVTLDKKTVNSYYQAAQRILTYPQTEVIVIGSSRGETTLPRWIERTTGQKALNVSTAGAELTTKKALLNIALKNAPIKKVIWLADYFELIDDTQDAKIKKTPALRKYLPNAKNHKNNWMDTWNQLQGLIDHTTTSASLHLMKRPPPEILDQGGSGESDENICRSEAFKGSESPESLKTKINILYQAYVNKVIRPLQNESAWTEFSEQIQQLAENKIQTAIVIIPYHPEFLSRLKKEYPDIHQRHMDWIHQVQSLESQYVKVLDYYGGIPSDDGSPKYWNDGVHFTCHSSIKMLGPILNQWNSNTAQ